METTTIKPERITTPIQLLAVWMTGLVLLVSAFITGSQIVKEPSWLPALFAITAVAIVPLFLFFVFLLQTKYRPEMQEDRYYSQYLDKDTLTLVDPRTALPKEDDDLNLKLQKLISTLEVRISEGQKLLATPTSGAKELSPPVRRYLNQLSPELDRAKQELRWSSISFNVNSRLQKVGQIIDFLKTSGANRIEVFTAGQVKLEVSLLSIPRALPLEIAKHLVSGTVPLGIDSICLNNKTTVYLGSMAFRPTGRRTIRQLDKSTLEDIMACQSVEHLHALILTSK